MNSFREQTIAVNGISLHVAQAGDPDGPLAILLHGFPENWQVWRELMNSLVEQGYWVWAPNQRGYHLSDAPQGVKDYTLDKLSADVLGLIDAAGREKAVLIGHDWGAMVSWWVAIHHPDRLGRLIALNGSHTKVGREFRRSNCRQILKSWYVFFFLIPGLPEWMARKSKWRILIRGMEKAARPGTFSEAYWADSRTAWSSPGVFRAMLHWYRAGMLHFPKMKENPRVDIPVLLLWGEKDHYIHRSLADASMKWCGNGKLVVFPDAGHWILHEEGEAVCREVVEFLS